MIRVGIVESGIGNSRAIQNVFHSIGVVAERIRRPEDFGNHHSHLVISGVGSFDSGIQSLKNSGWWDPLHNRIFKQPVLGICLGMQMLFSGSEEGTEPGLGVIDGWIQALDNEISRVPLIGWKRVDQIRESQLFDGLNDARFYFSHSYAFKHLESNDSVVSIVPHVENYAASVSKDNWLGVQFHPEKSHDFGKKLLENFVRFT